MKATKQSIKEMWNVVENVAYIELDLQKENREKVVQKKVFKDKMVYIFSREIKGIRPQTQEMLYTPRGINIINIFQGLSHFQKAENKR